MDSWAYNVDRGKVVLLDIRPLIRSITKSFYLNEAIMENAITRTLVLLYLDNRMQRCSVNVSLSRSCSFSCGVHQGTILRLLLFLLYCILMIYQIAFQMYADDTRLTYACFSAHNIQSYQEKRFLLISPKRRCNRC